MPHLPNELWLQIASYCEPFDLWRSLRLVNRQLKECAEQSFEENILPHIRLKLPIGLPSYDMRNRNWGYAIFHVLPQEPCIAISDSHRVVCYLHHTEPEDYRSHFLGQWSGLCDSSSRLWKQQWDVQLKGSSRHCRLREGIALQIPSTEQEDGDARVSFAWKPAVTSFFR